jgi:hypothetical protein
MKKILPPHKTKKKKNQGTFSACFSLPIGCMYFWHGLMAESVIWGHRSGGWREAKYSPHASPQGCTVRSRKGAGKCWRGGGYLAPRWEMRDAKYPHPRPSTSLRRLFFFFLSPCTFFGPCMVLHKTTQHCEKSAFFYIWITSILKKSPQGCTVRPRKGAGQCLMWGI